LALVASFYQVRGVSLANERMDERERVVREDGGMGMGPVSPFSFLFLLVLNALYRCGVLERVDTFNFDT
jgi:hypothetical protein